MTASLSLFYRIVGLLKALPPEYRVMAVHAAMFWSEERLDAAIAAGALPGVPDVASPKPSKPLQLATIDGECVSLPEHA
jgi:hypothetical protein